LAIPQDDLDLPNLANVGQWVAIKDHKISHFALG